MINHIRSYLVNKVLDHRLLGHELQDRLFKPTQQLPWYLTVARNALFGTSPDAFMLNYRAAQLVRIWHTTELDQLMRLRDSRISYDPLADVYSDLRLFQPVVATDGNGTVILAGGTGDPDDHGRLQSQWTFNLLDATGVKIVYQTGAEWDVTVDAGAAKHFQLPGTELNVTLTNFEPGDSTTVRLLSRPTNSIDRLLAKLTNLSEEVKSQLFGINTAYYAVPEVAAARELWLHHNEPILRLGAAALALAVATEEIR